MSFHEGVDTVTVLSEMVALLIDVGTENVMMGGKYCVVSELFQAVSYTLTVIA
jgi:hypothetical protein